MLGGFTDCGRGQRLDPTILLFNFALIKYY